MFQNRTRLRSVLPTANFAFIAIRQNNSKKGVREKCKTFILRLDESKEKEKCQWKIEKEVQRKEGKVYGEMGVEKHN